MNVKLITISFLFVCSCISNKDQPKSVLFAQMEKVFIRDTIWGQRISLFIRFENQSEITDTLVFRKGKSILNRKDPQKVTNSYVFIEDSSSNKIGDFELWGVEPDEVILAPKSSIKLLFLLESEGIKFKKEGKKSENLRIVERFLTENRIIFYSLNKSNQEFFLVVSTPTNIEYYYRAAFVDDLK